MTEASTHVWQLLWKMPLHLCTTLCVAFQTLWSVPQPLLDGAAAIALMFAASDVVLSLLADLLHICTSTSGPSLTHYCR